MSSSSLGAASCPKVVNNVVRMQSSSTHSHVFSARPCSGNFVLVDRASRSPPPFSLVRYVSVCRLGKVMYQVSCKFATWVLVVVTPWSRTPTLYDDLSVDNG